MSKTCAFITLGCKVNQYDTQVLREALSRKVSVKVTEFSLITWGHNGEETNDFA